MVVAGRRHAPARESPLRGAPGPSGILHRREKTIAAGWWAARIAADRVSFPPTITRQQLAELAAAEALTAEGGALRWRVIEGSAKSPLGRGALGDPLEKLPAADQLAARAPIGRRVASQGAGQGANLIGSCGYAARGPGRPGSKTIH